MAISVFAYWQGILKSTSAAAYRGSGLWVALNDFFGSGGLEAKQANLALITQELGRLQLDPSIPENWYKAGDSLSLKTKKGFHPFLGQIKAIAPFLGAIGGTISLVGAIYKSTDGKPHSTTEYLQMATAYINAVGSTHHFFKVGGFLQEKLFKNGNLATDLGIGEYAPWRPKENASYTLRDIFTDMPTVVYGDYVTGLLIAETAPETWAVMLRDAKASGNVPLMTAIIGRLEKITFASEAARDKVYYAMISAFDGTDLTHLTPLEALPQVERVSAQSKLTGYKKLISYGMPPLMALCDVAAGAFGFYLGIKNYQTGRAKGDDLLAKQSIIDVTSAGIQLAIGTAEVIALFAGRASQLLAIASPFGWAAAVALGITSLVIGFVRSAKQTNRERKDYRNFVDNIYRDGVARSDIKKPKWS